MPLFGVAGRSVENWPHQLRGLSTGRQGFLRDADVGQVSPADGGDQSSAKRERDPEEEKRVLEEVRQLSESPDLQTHDERNIDRVNYVKLERSVHTKKGKWLRFSEEQIQRMRERGEVRQPMPFGPVYRVNKITG